MSGRRSLRAARRANMRRLRLIWHVRAVHRLGERATFELVDDIARTLDAGDAVMAIAAKFASLDVDFLRAVGDDVFPGRPLRVVRVRT
jgi:hypothetical protein